MEYRNVPIIKKPRGQIVYCDCDRYPKKAPAKHVVIANNASAQNIQGKVSTSENNCYFQDESLSGHRRSVSVIHEWCKGQC